MQDIHLSPHRSPSPLYFPLLNPLHFLSFPLRVLWARTRDDIAAIYLYAVNCITLSPRYTYQSGSGLPLAG